ncbi:hypothetical protein FQA39_LY13600 [Lamprigera yunnana]|nr:hypothetical protein FQA39_LY13600 [Lamprigera yunnana]
MNATKRKRVGKKSEILTSTSFKEELAAKDAEKEAKENKAKNKVKKQIGRKSATKDYLPGHRFIAASTRRNIKRLNVEPAKSVTVANKDKDSSDSDVPTCNLTNDDSDVDHTEAAVEETQEKSEYITPQKEQIVLVKVKGGSRKKTTYRYVATLFKLTDKEEFELQGVKSVSKTQRVFQVELTDNDTNCFKNGIKKVSELNLEFKDLSTILTCFQ